MTSLWRNRDYLLLWSGQTVSAVGSQFSGFVIPLLVLGLTHSAAQAGFVAAVAGVPYIVLSLLAGVLVDRWNRKRVMIGCDSLRAFNMLSVPIAIALGHLGVGQLYAVSLIEGTLFVFFNIAETASLPRVVPTELLPAAVARQETTWGISAFAGPPLAGLLFDVARHALPFLADAASYFVSALSLSFIRSEFQTERGEARPGFVAGMTEALLWLWRRPLLRSLTIITAAGDFLFSGITLIPIVIARQEMHAPPFVIGLIFTLAALGAIIGSSVAARVQRRLRFAPTVIAGQWIDAVLFPLLAIVPNPLGLGLVRTAMSATVSISNTVRLSYPLALIPDEMQGRVNSLTSLLAYGSLPLGEALAGVLMQWLGPRPAVLVLGAGVLALALGTTLDPHVRRAPP